VTGVGDFQLPRGTREALAELWSDLQQAGMRADQDRAKADPVANKLTTVFSGPMRWLYFKPVRTRGRETRFCYSTTRNVAGYFLTWREIETGKRIRRDSFRASKRRKTVAEIARKRAATARSKITKP
jgi:hypothetical protein